MPTFRYTAKRGPHDVVEGQVEAENRAGVLSHLANLGYTPVRVAEGTVTAKAASVPLPKARQGRDGTVPARHLNVLTRQFASLVRSQVPLLRTLRILAEQATHPHLRRILDRVIEDVQQGDTLSNALEKHPRVFSSLYVNLVRAGEVGGVLEAVLDRLATQADQEEALRSKVQTAIAYPSFVGVVGVGTILFLLAFVMPRLLGLFEGFGDRLPLPTRLLLAISGVMSQPWFWGGLAVAVVGLVYLWKAKGSQARGVVDRVSLRLPLVGQLIRQLEFARFSRSFGLLLEHGVTVLQAVETAVAVVRHPMIRRELAKLPSFLQQGHSLASSLQQIKMVAPFVVTSVAVGEEGGRVGEALSEVATFYEREAERRLQMAAALLEPAMVLLVGLVVGFIVTAVLLPIFELGSIAR